MLKEKGLLSEGMGRRLHSHLTRGKRVVGILLMIKLLIRGYTLITEIIKCIRETSTEHCSLMQKIAKTPNIM